MRYKGECFGILYTRAGIPSFNFILLTLMKQNNKGNLKNVMLLKFSSKKSLTKIFERSVTNTLNRNLNRTRIKYQLALIEQSNF